MTEREGFWRGVVFFNLNTHAQKEGEKNHLGQWWRGGGEAPVRVKHRGGEREQHMCSGEGEETGETQGDKGNRGPRSVAFI